MPGTKQIRIGVVGCGNVARQLHLPWINATRGIRAAALFDVVAERGRELRNDLAPEAKLFDDYDAMLKSGINAVAICTPNHLHARLSIRALEAGMHVLCEKPMAGTVADATRMIEAAERNGLVLHINQTLRYHPLWRRVQRLSRPKHIGELSHMRFLRAGYLDPASVERPDRKWFFTQKAQGGILLDLGIHAADLMLWIGGRVTEVAAFTETSGRGMKTPDNARALLRFENGATGVLEMSWTMPAGAGHTEIYGARGRLRVVERSVELTRRTARGECAKLHPRYRRCTTSYRAFVKAVRGEAPSPTPGELGRRALAVCEAISQSGKNGSLVPVSPL